MSEFKHDELMIISLSLQKHQANYNPGEWQGVTLQKFKALRQKVYEMLKHVPSGNLPEPSQDELPAVKSKLDVNSLLTPGKLIENLRRLTEST